MADSGPTHARGTGGPPGQLEIIRRTSFGMTVALLIQYALGMVVNLYVTVPASDQGGGVLVAIGRAFANGPVALAILAGLGRVLVLGTVSLVVRSVASRRRPLIWLSSLTLLAVLGAAFNGAAFVNSGNDGSSLGMALLTGVALLCLAVTLYVTGAPGAAPPAVQRAAETRDGTRQDAG